MKRILVADDEYDLTSTLRAILERDGYQVEVRGDGLSALDRLRGGGPAPDLVVLDVMMPFLSGLEVLRELRTSSAASPPVLLIGSVPPRVRREEFGWDLFLAKPFSLEAFRRAVTQLITPDGPEASQ